jgi:hypothetical protein
MHMQSCVHTVYLKKLGKKDEPTCIRLGVIVCDDLSLFVLCFVIIALVVVGLVGRATILLGLE